MTMPVLLKLEEQEAMSLYLKGYTIYRGRGKNAPYLDKEVMNGKMWSTLKEEGYFDNKLPFYIKLTHIPWLEDTIIEHRNWVNKSKEI